jgi:uncharacterized protein HemX
MPNNTSQSYSRKLAAFVGLAVAAVIVVLAVAIGGSYFLTLHTVNTTTASRHASHCSELQHLVKSAEKANDEAKYPFGKSKSFGYVFTQGLDSYYKSQCNLR